MTYSRHIRMKAASHIFGMYARRVEDGQDRRSVGPTVLKTYLPLQTFCYVSSALWAAKAVRIIFADLGKYIPVDNFHYF